jgi:hypothetical protein
MGFKQAADGLPWLIEGVPNREREMSNVNKLFPLICYPQEVALILIIRVNLTILFATKTPGL